MKTAKYSDPGLPEYRKNPLIEALPPIWSASEVVDRLTRHGLFHPDERELDPQYRMHCVGRLFDYFQPLEEHLDIEQRLSLCIRQGYIGRNPLRPEYARAAAAGYEAYIDRDETPLTRYGSSRAAGFSIVGVSGVGKTSAVRRILNEYPQCVEHNGYQGLPLCETQIVWLALDCPHDGSIKALCLQFFEEIDRLLGTNHFASNHKPKNTVEVLRIQMTRLAATYHLGVLVVDELQHLSAAMSGGSRRMMDFFVTLVNTIGVPVVLIGTNKAMSLLRDDFRHARRGSCLGDLLWDRMKEDDPAWDAFVISMWDHQWTREKVLLTREMKQALYEGSQGIADVAVKLYAMVQIKAIATGEETFDAKDFRIAADEKFGLIKPMLDALRSGNEKELARYEDIAPIRIEDYLANYVRQVAPDPNLPQLPKEPSGDVDRATVELIQLRIDPKVARITAGELAAAHPDWSWEQIVTESICLKASRPSASLSSSEAPDKTTAKKDEKAPSGYEELAAAGQIEAEKWT